MKIEVGKTYRTRGGDKVKVTAYRQYLTYPFISGKGTTYTYDGRFWDDGDESQEDLIAEWTDTAEVGTSRANQSPVREVMRKEIVPGVYGSVKVHDPGSKYVRINVDASMDANGLTAAINTLTQIRDALEEMK